MAPRAPRIRARIAAALVIAISATALAGVAPAEAAIGDITTIAGTGVATSTGDGGPATAATLQEPVATAEGPDGDLYVVERAGHRVRRIDAATGTITTVAGTGALGFSGDDGPATAATLNLPNGVAVDADGNVFIADTWNERIRRVDAATGTITTYAGLGLGGYAGDGVAADTTNLQKPIGLVLDGNGDLLVTDSYNHRIRKIDHVSTVITTVVGSGFNGGAFGGYNGDDRLATTAHLAFPTGLAIAPDGDIVFTDQRNQRIRRVDAVSNMITTVAGTGTNGYNGDPQLAATANLANPNGVAVGPDGAIFVTDTDNFRLRRIDPTTQIITTVAGTGVFGFDGDDKPATTARLSSPTGVLIQPNGNLLIADSAANRMRRVSAAPDAASVQVVVRTDGGAIINGANVTVRNAADEVVGTGTTWRGVVVVPNAPTGALTVTVRHRGTQDTKAVNVGPGANLVEFALPAAQFTPDLLTMAPSGHTVASDEATGFVRVGVRRATGEPLAFTFTPTCDPAGPASNVSVTLGSGTPVAASQVGSGTSYSISIARADIVAGPIATNFTCPGGSGSLALGFVQLFDPSGILSDAVTGDPVVGASITLHEVPTWRARTAPNDTAPGTCESNDSKAPEDPWSQEAPTGLGVVIDQESERISPNMNPQPTSATGYYGWDVAAGCWYVTVVAEGYAPLTSPVVGVPPEVIDLDLDLQPLARFSDVPVDYTFFEDIHWMVAKGITNGFADGTFRPTGGVTRQALATFLWRQAGSPDPAGDAPTFTDVPANHPFRTAISWLAGEGITTGYPDGTFRPSDVITRQAMATFLWRKAGSPTPPQDAPTFTDVPADHPFQKAIAWLADEGISTGYPDGTFRPTAVITRQAMAAFLRRFADVPL